MAEETIEGWLTDTYDYQRPRRGQIREGVILRMEKRGVIVDVGLKREGIVPQNDVERLGRETASQLEPDQKVTISIVRPEDREGNLILSLYRARLERDWAKAQEMLENGKVCQCKVIGCNRGGVKARFRQLYGFVPGSHLWMPGSRKLSSDKREEKFKEYIGRELSLKVIEVERGRRRLILSERLARHELRKQHTQRLLDELLEGQVVQGTVSRLCDFGAFVDLGGADGLVHISELAWRRIRHPSQVVQVGDEIDVYVLRLDHTRKRIGLSLKRMQPDPWSLVELSYREGQLISGVVTSTVNFGAFVALDLGVEGLIHISELADPLPMDPRTVVGRGDELVVRILRIEPSRRRIGLSLKDVSLGERDEWLQRARLDQPGVAALGGDAIADDDATLSEDASSTDVSLTGDRGALAEAFVVAGGMAPGEPQEM